MNKHYALSIFSGKIPRSDGILLIMRGYSFFSLRIKFSLIAGIPLIMRGYSFTIGAWDAPYSFVDNLRKCRLSAGIPLIMRGTPSGLLVF